MAVSGTSTTCHTCAANVYANCHPRTDGLAYTACAAADGYTHRNPYRPVTYADPLSNGHLNVDTADFANAYSNRDAYTISNGYSDVGTIS